MSRLGRWGVVTVTLALALSACASVDRPTVQADEIALPTPLSSYGTSVASTVSALEAAVGAVGSSLEVPAAAYRPSEPQSLLQAPRVVMRANLADSDDGYLVIYEADGQGSATEWARELADYLGSGFGQTNYPADTQFSVTVLADTVILTTWSSRRSDDRERAEAVFDAIAGVGEAVEVAK